MAQFDLTNLKKPRNTSSGVADRVFIALVEWFIDPGGIKSPGFWAQLGDGVLIKDAHEFKPGRGFIELRLAPEKNKYDAKTIGDTGFQKFANELNVFVPGSYVDEHELMFNLLNKPVIALIEDSNCPASMLYQVGSSCVYAYVSPGFSTGTTKEGVKGYILNIQNTANKVYLYQGDIIAGPEPLVAKLNGSIAGTTVSLDALDSIIYGTMQYEYTVYYNDTNGDLQTIVLPGTTDDTSFETSILTDWNEAGFAVKLKISNEFESDSTISSDSIGERPYFAGGFDDGFDDGFDYNITIN